MKLNSKRANDRLQTRSLTQRQTNFQYVSFSNEINAAFFINLRYTLRTQGGQKKRNALTASSPPPLERLLDDGRRDAVALRLGAGDGRRHVLGRRALVRRQGRRERFAARRVRRRRDKVIVIVVVAA